MRDGTRGLWKHVIKQQIEDRFNINPILKTNSESVDEPTSNTSPTTLAVDKTNYYDVNDDDNYQNPSEFISQKY